MSGYDCCHECRIGRVDLGIVTEKNLSVTRIQEVVSVGRICFAILNANIASISFDNTIYMFNFYNITSRLLF